MKYTPGPWKMEEGELNGVWEGVVYNDRIGTICRLDDEMSGCRANAALIAAAPDMLATLEAIRNDCHAWLDGEMDSLSQGDLLQAFANAAQLAIDEATGEK